MMIDLICMILFFINRINQINHSSDYVLSDGISIELHWRRTLVRHIIIDLKFGHGEPQGNCREPLRNSLSLRFSVAKKKLRKNKMYKCATQQMIINKQKDRTILLM